MSYSNNPSRRKFRLFLVFLTIIVLIYICLPDSNIQPSADWYSNNLGLWMENNRHNPFGIAFGIVSGIILFYMACTYVTTRQAELKDWDERDKKIKK